MRNRRRSWFFRRLVLGFAIALVAVPVAQAYPDEGGAKAQGTFVQGVDDFPGSSELAPQANGVAVRGEVKDGIGTSPGGAVIVGDDKRDIGARPTATILVGDDKWNVPLGPIHEPTVAAEYQYAYWPIVNPADYPQAAILAELDAKTSEYVAGAAPVGSEPIQVVSNSNGFDWGDAGIGAGSVFAVMLLGAGALLATRHVGHPAQV
jgi:hypothetical protein